MFRRLSRQAIAIVVASLLAACVEPPAQVPTPSLGAGDYRRTLDVAGQARSYRVHVPPTSTPGQPLPLVLVFHGRGADGAAAERQTRFSDAADQRGFVVAYPDGSGRSWNNGTGVGAAARRGVDDVGFTGALLDELQRLLSIDPSRVYAVGGSNGGVFVYRLACELSARLAAVAVVAGSMAEDLNSSCAPSNPISILHIHGTDDRLMPWSGGKSGGGGQVLAVPDTIAGWVQRDGCASPASVSQPTVDVKIETWSQCQAGSEVILCTIQHGGHTWPGAKVGPVGRLVQPLVGSTNMDIDATAMIADFFARHART